MGSKMLSHGVWYWTALVVVSLCPQGTHTVALKVQSTVVTDHRAAEVILPCEYKLDNPGHVYNIRWDIGRDVVIVKDTADQLFYGSKYTGRVKWGEGCSLVLISPGLNDTGRYQFNIAAPEDEKKWGTVHVQLIVIEAGIGKTTTGVVGCIPQSNWSTPGLRSTQSGHKAPRWEDFVPMAIIPLANLIFQAFFVRYHERHGCKDKWRRLYLGGYFVLLVTGVITAGIGMALRSRTVLLVSSSTITLGVVIQGIYVFWIVKRQFEDSVRNPSPCSTDTTVSVSFLSDKEDVKMEKPSEIFSANSL